MCEATDNATSETAGLKPPGRKTRVMTGMLIVLVSLFLNAAGKQQIPVGALDEEAYLSLAAEISEESGFWAFPAYYLSGGLDDAYRGPMYVWLLSSFYHGERHKIGYVRALNVIIGAAAALVCYVLLGCLCNWTVAAIGGLLVAASANTTFLGGITSVEPLLTVACLFTWYLYLRGLEGKHRYWAGALAMTGVCFYLKAQGLFFAPAFIITGLICYKWDFFRNKNVWIGLALLAIILAPNVLHNVNAFGKPLYSKASKELWLDSILQNREPDWEEKYGGPVQYFRTHSVGDFAQRMVVGFVEQVAVISGGLLAPTKVSGAAQYISYILGALAFVAFLIGIAAEGDRKRMVFHVALLVIFLACFSLRSAVGPYPRFYLPIIGLFALYAGSGFLIAYRGLEGTMGKPGVRRLAIILGALVTLWALMTIRKVLFEVGLSVWHVP